MAAVLGLTEIELIEKLIAWGREIPFKIDGDMIVVDDLANFTTAMDAQFDSWTRTEKAGAGKLGKLGVASKPAPPAAPSPVPARAPRAPVAEPVPAVSIPPARLPAAAAAARRKAEAEAREPRDYHGTALAAGERAAMMDLERALGGKPIPRVEDVQWDTFGFAAGGGHVAKLGLYKHGLTSLPESIGNLTALNRLFLYNNQLSSLPESIGNLTALTQLYLYKNQLSSLPETIGNLKSLTYLDLSNNQLSSLPESIGQLTSLEVLDLDENKLSSLPESIGNLESLEWLYLNGNQLSSLPGTIEKWIADLKKRGCNVSL